MDKRKVIEAYYRGLLTIEECAQVLGSNRMQVVEMLERKPDFLTHSNTYTCHTEQV